jgi:hypothetical protein
VAESLRGAEDYPDGVWKGEVHLCFHDFQHFHAYADAERDPEVGHPGAEWEAGVLFSVSEPAAQSEAVQAEVFPEPDTKVNVSEYDRWELVNYSRQLRAQIDVLSYGDRGEEFMGFWGCVGPALLREE